MKMSPLSNKDLRRIFTNLDKNGDGQVSVEELNWLLETIGVLNLDHEELESFVGKSSLNIDEFFAFYNSINTKETPTQNEHSIVEEEDDDDRRSSSEDSDLFEAFNVFDMDGDGFISSEELQVVLKKLGLYKEGFKDCTVMINFYDTNFDGVLDFQEFKRMMLFNDLPPHD